MSLGYNACFYGEGEQEEIIYEKHPGSLTIYLSLFYASGMPRSDF